MLCTVEKDINIVLYYIIQVESPVQHGMDKNTQRKVPKDSNQRTKGRSKDSRLSYSIVLIVSCIKIIYISVYCT